MLLLRYHDYELEFFRIFDLFWTCLLLLVLFFMQYEISVWSCSYLYFLNSIFRGPTFGIRGKVLLPFEDNPLSKIGVRFDKLITDGVDLGGLCEPGYGFFCNGNVYFVIDFSRLYMLGIILFILWFYIILLRSFSPFLPLYS